MFKRFIALPGESPHDVASFQATWGSDPDERGTLYCTLARQLAGEPDDPLAGLTRSVQLEYSFEMRYSEEYADLEVWSDEFATLRDFTAHVEQLPHFPLLMTRAADTCELYQEEDDGR